LLFFIGAYEAKTNYWINLVEWLANDNNRAAAGFAGYLIGHLIGAVPGL